MVDLVFLLLTAAAVAIGLVCAAQVDRSTPYATRIALLSPALAALYTFTMVGFGKYHAYWPDVMRTVAMLAVYWIAARPLFDKD